MEVSFYLSSFTFLVWRPDFDFFVTSSVDYSEAPISVLRLPKRPLTVCCLSQRTSTEYLLQRPGPSGRETHEFHRYVRPSRCTFSDNEGRSVPTGTESEKDGEFSFREGRRTGRRPFTGFMSSHVSEHV